MTTGAVGALTGIIPVAVAGGVALGITERALGQRGKSEPPSFHNRKLSKGETIEIVKAAFRLRLTATEARAFTKRTGRKLPTLAQAKKTVAKARSLQNTKQLGAGGLKRRRGL